MTSLFLAVAGLLVFLIGGIGLGRCFSRLFSGLSRYESIGVGGLLALGLLATFVALLGSIAGMMAFACACGLALMAAGSLWLLYKKWNKVQHSDLAFLGVAFLAFFPALVQVSAPLDSREWDTLAYHLAVPKVWLEEGQLGRVETIHHSNFPMVVESLHAVGFVLGGHQVARAATLCLTFLVGLALYGWLSRKSGPVAAWCGFTLFATAPVVMWQSGTAYIDVVHAGFGILGAVYLLEASQFSRHHKQLLLIGSLLLGFCLASKHTGLTVALSTVPVFALLCLRNGAKSTAVSLGFVSGLVASVSVFWYAKAFATTGNPVFPFFYELFGGSDWSSWQAAIYREEQGSFGLVGLPASVGSIPEYFSLALAPGFFTNPQQQLGLGLPIGFLGPGLIIASALGLASIKSRWSVAWISVHLLLLLLWAFLSAQSRYGAIVCVSSILLLPDILARFPKALVVTSVAVHSLTSILMFFGPTAALWSQLSRVGDASQPVAAVAFSDAAEVINKSNVSRVALYDEVFGFLLDVPYIWANPGHTLKLHSPEVLTTSEYEKRLIEHDISHVYVSLQFSEPEFRAGIEGAAKSVAIEVPTRETDQRIAWRMVVLAAIHDGVLLEEWRGRQGILYRVVNGQEARNG